MKDCYKCEKAYMITRQRWCYDSKIDYLFESPIIHRKQQKQINGINKLAVSYEKLLENEESYEYVIVDEWGVKIQNDFNLDVFLEDKIKQLVMELILDEQIIKEEILNEL